MSLIQCKDCGKQISDAAATCPSCGAPLPVVIGEGQEQCPHCMTVVHKDATVCPSCHAQKGYATNAYGVMGKTSVIIFGVALPAVIALVFHPAAIVCVPLALFCLWRIWNGPYWYHSKN
ncbi:zinc ribbon domain-containing protein [Rhodanobacter spathiphylli]|uniref:DZANK-type domain-containing protein n=1 Tax=Rhodanobacter spathiphylli B39 TaxID=1163407 RepID=I4W4D3_9GAMM|nr:zinc ribbon domain-containing protein [Rhodanobacter spathiphylli]EIL94324.1 hypothetical protein UU7_04972 [Rhodanobacter spathiphylli B39]